MGLASALRYIHNSLQGNSFYAVSHKPVALSLFVGLVYTQFRRHDLLRKQRHMGATGCALNKLIRCSLVLQGVPAATNPCLESISTKILKAYF